MIGVGETHLFFVSVTLITDDLPTKIQTGKVTLLFTAYDQFDSYSDRFGDVELIPPEELEQELNYLLRFRRADVALTL